SVKQWPETGHDDNANWHAIHGAFPRSSAKTLRRAEPSPASPLEPIKQHRAQNDKPKNNALGIRANASQIHAIANDGNQERTKQRSQDLPLAAAQARAANHHGGNDI